MICIIFDWGLFISSLMSLDPIKILSWNCRGAGNRNFLMSLKDLISVHRPEIVAILEPRISGRVADGVCSNIGWEHWYRVEAQGFSGGIWLFWWQEKLEVKIIHEHHQFVHLRVSSRLGASWYLTVVYASPTPSIRRYLWEDLRRLSIKTPWCIIGDFNVVMYPHERLPLVMLRSSFWSGLMRRVWLIWDLVVPCSLRTMVRMQLKGDQHGWIGL